MNMSKWTRLTLVLALALLAGFALWATLTRAAPRHAPLIQGGAPTVVSYQGEVRVAGTLYTDTGYFKFAVVDSPCTTLYWSNDGTGDCSTPPTAAVPLDISDGLFGVLLGDTSLNGMTQPLTAGIFSQPDRYLRVWFSSGGSTFSRLVPDTRIAAVPYALQAEQAASAPWSGITGAPAFQQKYAQVVVVAKSGGDYTSVQAAINSITTAAAGTPYLVWVAPGMYSETVTLKPHVHLQGAGQQATVITSTAGSTSWPPTRATLVLTRNTSLRELTVGNGGTDSVNVALMATAGTTETLVADVTVQARGSGTDNYAIYLTGVGTGVILQQVTALAENGSSWNIGLWNYGGASATVRGGAFTGRGGGSTYGIRNSYSGTTLEAADVMALGENGGANHGLWNSDDADATLWDGSFTGRGGSEAYGTYNESGATLEAEGTTALGENGSSTYGLYNAMAAVTLRGGAFTGRGGGSARGTYNYGSGTILEATSITALGENGSTSNIGLSNVLSATATLRGGAFTGRGGSDAKGIANENSGTMLEVTGITALAGDGSTSNFGLHNRSGATATLRGGSFTGRGGSDAKGIANENSGTTLEAMGVVALADNGSSFTEGLYNRYGAAATLRGGSFSARGGTNARGIYNDGSGTTLQATRVALLGEGGSFGNYGLMNISAATATADSSQLIGATDGLFQNGGTVEMGVSLVDGGVTKNSGTLVCFQVYDASYSPYTCP